MDDFKIIHVDNRRIIDEKTETGKLFLAKQFNKDNWEDDTKSVNVKIKSHWSPGKVARKVEKKILAFKKKQKGDSWKKKI